MFSEVSMLTYVIPVLVLGSIAFVLALILAVATKYLADYGPCRLTVNDDKEIEVKGGESLLSSLIANKIFIPSACGGRGSCGYCKVGILEGGGDLLPTELPYLTPKEIDNHLRLSCQVKVKEDLRLKIPEEYLAIQEFRAAVLYSKKLTYDMKEIRFKLIDPPEIRFKPGQYIQFNIPTAKGESVYRAYSIASLPSSPGEIELIVRLVPGGIGSTYIHNLTEGAEVTISGPYGEFLLQEKSDDDVLCVGGGAGMAPLKSIIYALFEKGTERKVDLFFGARAMKDLFYLDEFESLKKKHPNFSYTYALSSPETGDNWNGENGFIHLVLEKQLKEGEQKEAYLCGPPVMIDAVIKVLKEKGVDEGKIYYDKF